MTTARRPPPRAFPQPYTGTTRGHSPDERAKVRERRWLVCSTTRWARRLRGVLVGFGGCGAGVEVVGGVGVEVEVETGLGGGVLVTGGTTGGCAAAPVEPSPNAFASAL